jgi:hypothetical protein
VADLHDFSNDDNAISAFQSEADFAVPPRTAVAPTMDDDALACFAPELVLPAIAIESPAVDRPLNGLSVFPEESETEHSDSAVTAAKRRPSEPIQRLPKTWRLATVVIVVLTAPSAIISLDSHFEWSGTSVRNQTARVAPPVAPAVVERRETWPLTVPVLVVPMQRSLSTAALSSFDIEQPAITVGRTTDQAASPTTEAAIVDHAGAKVDVEAALVPASSNSGSDASPVAAPIAPELPLPTETRGAAADVPVEPIAPAAEEAIRRAVHSYREAYQSLDASAAAAVWPSVDRRALTRVFATLKSQGLEFERCAITMSDTQATVSCRGLLQVVPKFGNPVPLTSQQQWVFRMRRIGPDWKIDDVSASQTKTGAARGGGQD